MEKLFACVDARAAELKQLLKDIICINSYTPDKEAVDAVGNYLKAFAEKEDAVAEFFSFGRLFSRIFRKKSGKFLKKVLIL